MISLKRGKATIKKKGKVRDGRGGIVGIDKGWVPGGAQRGEGRPAYRGGGVRRPPARRGQKKRGKDRGGLFLQKKGKRGVAHEKKHS